MAPMKMISAVLLISFVLHAAGKPVTTSFNFPSFSPLPASISLQRDSFPSGGSLDLNYDAEYSNGRAIYSSPVNLWDKMTGNAASFSTRFSFSVFRAPDAPDYADGLVFFLAPVGYGVLANTSGGGFGLFNWDGVKSPVVAVEFDTFQNEWDLAAPHVGIDIGSIKSDRQSFWDPFVGRKNVTATAEISYNVKNKKLSAKFMQGSGKAVEVSSTVDLRKQLPEKVSVGFAGSTGSYYERHVLHSWSFSSSL